MEPGLFENVPYLELIKVMMESKMYLNSSVGLKY